MVRLAERILFAALIPFWSAPAADALAPPPPSTYLDEAGTRFLTFEWLERGMVNVSLRTVGGPGSYGRWSGAGKQTPKGIEFAQKAEEGAEPAGAIYLAAGGQSRVTVKLKPGQADAVDAGLLGTYRRVPEERVAALARKDYDAVEKILDDALKLASRKAPPEDKPALAEWKRRWPELRSRLFAALVPAGPAGASPSGGVPTQAGPGTSALPGENQAEFWLARAQAVMAAVNFANAGIPMGLKPGWDGFYDDGFGGSINLIVVSNGDARFTLNMARGDGSRSGSIEGRIAAATIKEAKDGTASGEFVESGAALKEGERPARLRFRRVGHFLLIDSQDAARHAGRGWFDGVYAKRELPREE